MIRTPEDDGRIQTPEITPEDDATEVTLRPQILAGELGVPFVQTAAPALERKGDVAAFLTALEPRSIFFVDEIHRLSRVLEETFYPAMEDGRLPITVGVGAGARVMTLDLPPFTLVGATTRAGRCGPPAGPRRAPRP